MLSFPTTPDPKIEITDLTHSVVDGNGVFDKLMKAVNAHLQQEWQQGRIKGTEYSTVYLSAIEHVLRVSLEFTLTKDKASLELELLKISKEKETAQVALLQRQTANLALEADNIPKQGLLIDAQRSVQTQQATNLGLESANIPKQGLLIDAQKEVQLQQKVNLVSEELRIDAQTAQIAAETLNIPKQGVVLDKQALDIAQGTLLKTQQTANAVIEGTVLTNTAAKVTAEKNLLDQRKISEEAQVNPASILPGSVIAKNIDLVSAQTTGYTRDAEQKAAKIMADAFAVQATVDENTLTTIGTANLSATDIGSVITKLKTGIGI